MAYKWKNEVELGEAVVAYLRSEGWTVYPEIEKIDIVATRLDNTFSKSKKIIGIECKTQFNLRVLEQAWRRHNRVDEMWIAVPHGYSHHNAFGSLVASKFGLGVFYVEKKSEWSGGGYKVTISSPAIAHPRKHSCIESLLDPEAQYYSKPGQCGGKKWSKFRQTVNKLIKYVEENPGCDATVAIKAIDHHYHSHGSARSNLIGFVKSGKVIPELLLENKRLYPRKNLLNGINKTDI